MEELIRDIKIHKADRKLEVLERLKPLVLSSICKYYYRPKEMEDLIQDGYVKILESIDDFDMKKGIYFLGYIKMNLKFLYLDKNRGRDHLSLNAKIGSDEGSQEFLDMLPDDGLDILDQIIRSTGNMELYKAYEQLADRQKEIVDLYYIKGMTMVQIAEALGISYRSVINSKAKAIKRLKRILEE